ncbi:MAG: hypothetical protein JST93_17200 [Acidobacteria bacterium]|nr:hypothetical protein [Acidobacteriota bacterium]
MPEHQQARLHMAALRKLTHQMSKADPSELPSLAFLIKAHVDIAIEDILAALQRMNSPLSENLATRLVK